MGILGMEGMGTLGMGILGMDILAGNGHTSGK
jgi:hypothetical protein